MKHHQDEHELPQRYLGQIADYITQRAQQAAPTLGVAPATATAPSVGGFNGVGDPTGD